MKEPKKLMNHFNATEKKSFWGKKSHQAFYNSTRWRKFRKNFIDENPLCNHCEQEGMTVLSVVADHIQPMRKGGSAWSYENLQALCSAHHNKKSATEKD